MSGNTCGFCRMPIPDDRPPAQMTVETLAIAQVRAVIAGVRDNRLRGEQALEMLESAIQTVEYTQPSPAALVDRLISLHNLLAENPTAFVDDVIGEDELAVLKAAATLARPADGWAHVAWRNQIIDGWLYFNGTDDPRDVHDNGRPYEKVYVSASPSPPAGET